MIRAETSAKAAAILEAEDPEAALAFNEDHDSEGGITLLETNSDESETRLDANVELMRQLGFGGMPGLVARSEDGSLTSQSGVLRGAAFSELFGRL